MKISLRRARTIPAVLGLVVLPLLATGCDDQPTTVLVENDYPPTATAAASEPGTTVFKVWWVTTLFPSPVAPGAVSETERTIPSTDFAYALLAPGWSPDSATPPTRLVALESTQKLTASAHQLLTIALSDQLFTGNCAAGSVLGDDDAQLIVHSIFPGSFAGLSYDPATCTTAPVTTDAGAPADAATE
jgi:hypothetical protein